jgi:hypothetical protein
VDDITMCRLSPNGDRLAVKRTTTAKTREKTSALVVADLRTGRKLLDLEDRPVGRPFWSVDGSRLALVLADKVVVYDALTGKQLCTCDGPRLPP